MNFDSDIEHSDVESIGSSAHMCETELEEDHEKLYSSDPEAEKDPRDSSSSSRLYLKIKCKKTQGNPIR